MPTYWPRSQSLRNWLISHWPKPKHKSGLEICGCTPLCFLMWSNSIYIKSCRTRQPTYALLISQLLTAAVLIRLTSSLIDHTGPFLTQVLQREVSGPVPPTPLHPLFPCTMAGRIYTEITSGGPIPLETTITYETTATCSTTGDSYSSVTERVRFCSCGRRGCDLCSWASSFLGRRVRGCRVRWVVYMMEESLLMYWKSSWCFFFFNWDFWWSDNWYLIY